MDVPAVLPVKSGLLDAGPAAGPPIDVPAEAAAHTLQDMAADFTFFTTALIITHGLFDRDPLVEFNNFHPAADTDLLPFAIDSERPFFQQLGRTILNGQLVDWDHRLYGIVNSRWDACREFIARISLLDTARQHYARLAWHELLIIDPITLRDKPFLSELPTLKIFSFAVSSNRHFSYLAPAKDPPRTRPYPLVEAPHPDILPEAAAVLGPPPDPSQLLKRLEDPGCKQ